ncbi:MAG: GAF domain-containing sensor histidine kinase [Anaerolineae bacterium]|nr:GAF domain-containing sensor histidine kinase [Anaerolineae bacterium]
MTGIPKPDIFPLGALPQGGKATKNTPGAPTWADNKVGQIMFGRLTKENKEITTLYNIGVTINSSLCLEEVISKLHKESNRLIDTSNFAITVYNERAHTLDFLLVFEQGQKMKPFSVQLSNRQNLSDIPLTHQIPLLARDILENNVIESNRLRSEKPIRSWLGATLLNPALPHENALGAIVVWSYEPDAFTNRHLWLLSAIGTQAAIAIRNVRLFEAGQRQTMEMVAINNVTRTLSATFQLDDALNCIMSQVYNLFNAETALLLLVEPATGDLVVQTVLGNNPASARSFRIRQGQGAAGKVALTGKAIVMNNGNKPARNLLCAPLVLYDRVIGVLEVRNKKGDFSRNDLELLQAIASCAAIAIENARLRENMLAERDRVIEIGEQTRKEVASDLHDGPIQLVSAMMMQLQFCRQALEKDPSLLPKQFVSMHELGQQAVHQMRTMLFELRPLVLETEGLVAALRVFLERRRQEVKTIRLTLTLKTHQPSGQISRLEDKVEVALFAIVQEAVNNALKHAQANNIIVHLKESPTAIYATIVDDGKGFEIDKVMRNYEQRGSLGLVNIRERTELIGGELAMNSAPSRGTHISVYVPKAKEERMQKRATTGRLSRPFNTSPGE